jgi:pimeloyl-ACP methyl ester carboxylesterase
MPMITTKDGTEIYYKDWGKGQPIVFSHGWPLSADDWDTQMLFFLNHGESGGWNFRKGQVSYRPQGRRHRCSAGRMSLPTSSTRGR